jgi:hypothetical protein
MMNRRDIEGRGRGRGAQRRSGPGVRARGDGLSWTWLARAGGVPSSTRGLLPYQPIRRERSDPSEGHGNDALFALR